jgi:hypothetical protein
MKNWEFVGKGKQVVITWEARNRLVYRSTLAATTIIILFSKNKSLRINTKHLLDASCYWFGL